MKTAQTIEQQKAEQSSGKRPNGQKRKMHPNSLANLVAPWTPETRPNVVSPGRPRDVAGEISRAIFENNREALYKAGKSGLDTFEHGR